MCSAAETTVDSGAFATTMPRRVAASTSTLSTPTPARPITFRFDAELDQLGGQLRRRADDDRVVAADDLGEIAVGVDVDVEVLAQEIDAGGSDRLADEDAHASGAGDPRVLVRLERRGHGDAALDVGAEIDEHDLDRREHRRDVEDVEPADVAEPEDLPEQVALPVRDRHAEAVAQASDDVARRRRRRARAPR